MTFDAGRLPELYAEDRERVARARRRQAAVWRGERPDAWPLLLSGRLGRDQQDIPDPDFKDAFEHIDLMICGGVRQACAVANAGSDAVPSVRGNYGTGVLLSCFGLEQDVFPDKMPWLKQHLTRTQIAALEPGDIEVRGTFARGLEFMRRFRALMGDSPALYCMDAQGPLDLAHLLYGDDLFCAFTDDPPFVHHLLEICLALNIAAHERMKEIAGEAPNQGHHSNGLYAENVGVRICEDTTAVVGPAVIEAFAMPYTRRLARHFGAAWVHYCGRSDVLTRAACEVPEVRGINFGHIPGRLHDHPFEADMELIAGHGKVYFGVWPRFDGESGRDYLRRLHAWAARGCLVPQAFPALDGDDGFASVEAALDFWYSL